ncbi:MAG: ABC-F family ATP-binding cassette domain-containing protein [Actinomycetota bacterium]
MITISGLGKAFGSQTLFSDAQMRATAGERVAVVGPNGSGKTTLFDMISSAQLPDSGRIDLSKGVVLGYLKQETDALRGRSILEEVLSAGAAMTEAGHRLELIAEDIAHAQDENERTRLLNEYATLQHRFEALGGYQIESDAKRILSGLGFRATDFDRLTDELSGGWLMRVALAKLLLQRPDILLLDEPTNHLDVESVAWLEQFLKEYEGTVLLISHDRDFMNGMCSKIVEITRKQLDTYTGNYASFVEQRTARMEALRAAARNQQKRIEQLETFINRFRYKQSKASQAQSKIKLLGKMERIEVPIERKRRMGLAFPAPPRPGRVVLDLQHVRFAYGSNVVYDSLDLSIERGQKVALVGPNGAGKTTLLKLFAGALRPQSGERIEGHNVNVGYFAQHQIEALIPTNRVIEELQRAVPAGVVINARTLLGRFLFSGDDIDKPVSVLSGGERSRLALARLLVQPHNVLCLDEPTNHLDIESRDVLEDALEEYEGAIVLITHDRHLIRSIANRIVEVTPGKLRTHPGDYESYLYRKQLESEPVQPSAPKTARSEKDRKREEARARAVAKRLKDAVRDAEREIELEEAALRELERKLADPVFYANGGAEVADAVKEYETRKTQISLLEERWTELASRVTQD